MKQFFWTAILAALVVSPAQAKDIRLLNASYDPTRELYEDYNDRFTAQWGAEQGQKVKIRQSHGGSGKQARAIIDGLPADVATLALAYDIDAIAEKSAKVPLNWRERLPNNAVPFNSVIVFLVRKGNPKHIYDWNDVVKPGVQVVMPNPKTSGGARWNYLSAWVYALKANSGDEAAAQQFIGDVYKGVKVLDAGARASTTTFAQRKIGDVLVTWENEAYLAKRQLGENKFEIIYPSISILAETPVAVVESNTEKRGTTSIAYSYLLGLFEPEAQRLAAEHYFRPVDADILEQHRARFPEIETVTIRDLGGWQEVQKKHFNDGGIFDQVYGRNP